MSFQGWKTIFKMKTSLKKIKLNFPLVMGVSFSRYAQNPNPGGGTCLRNG